MKLYGKEVVVLKIYKEHFGTYVVRRFCFGDGKPRCYTKQPPFRVFLLVRRTGKYIKFDSGFKDVSRFLERMTKYEN